MSDVVTPAKVTDHSERPPIPFDGSVVAVITPTKVTGHPESLATASFLRRLGAMFYDSMLALSFILVVGFLSMWAIMSLLGLENVTAGSPLAKVFFVYLLLLTFLFYGWFWTHGGQTLGMRAWKLKLVRNNNFTVNWFQAFMRFCYALISWLPLGAGYLWMLIDRNRFAWHDRISRSYIIDLKK